MLMWVMSDRAIPRSYRMMQGFGVHTFRLVNERGEVVFVKFHWNPMRGHAFAGLGRGGEDLRRRSGLPSPRSVGSDRGRRVSRVGARACRSSPRSRPRSSASTCSTRPRSFPRSWCRCSRSAAWCSTAIPTTSSPRPSRSRSAPRTSCPGIDFSNDPLLAGRIHSYVDTQITRLGGPELPRDPDQRAGRAGAQQPARRHASPGDPSRPRGLRAELARRRLSVPGRRARASRRSRSRSRRTRCAASRRSSPSTTRRRRCSTTARRRSRRRTSSRAFRFELTKVQVPAIRERVVVAAAQRRRGAGAAGRRGPRHRRARSRCRRCCRATREPEVKTSPALSLFARPGDGGIRTRRIAILVADGVDGAALHALHAALLGRRRRAALRRAAARARCTAAAAIDIEVEVTLETAPSVLFDAVVVAGRRAGVAALVNSRPRARVRQGPVPPLQADPGARARAGDCSRRRAFRPSSPTASPIRACCVRRTMPTRRAKPFIAALAKHRHFERQTDPPRV